MGDGEGESANDETDGSVDDGFSGFFGLARVAGRGHVLDATINDDDDGDEAEDTDDGFDDVADYGGGIGEIGLSVWTTGSGLDF